MVRNGKEIKTKFTIELCTSNYVVKSGDKKNLLGTSYTIKINSF
jgi:hypothetical protein